MQDFRNLKIWTKSHQLALNVYELTRSFPKEELFGLTSQLRRAALSIPTNISEGCGRGTDSDFARFIQISIGSASEIEYLLLFCKELNFIKSDDYKLLNNEIIEIKKSLITFLKKLRHKI